MEVTGCYWTICDSQAVALFVEVLRVFVTKSLHDVPKRDDVGFGFVQESWTTTLNILW